jgi:transposase
VRGHRCGAGRVGGLRPGPGSRDAVTGAPAELIASYGTTTPDLLELVDWLRGLGVTDVAMESTGVYWKPIVYLLEDDFTVLLVNAAHIKHVPGRKTDTIDAAWIAQLLAHGLLTASFVPPPPVRELRDLTRYRKALINEKTAQVNRIHKVLQDSGIKPATYATEVMGVSGRAMMRALIAGQSDSAVLAELAKGRMRTKIPDLRKALTGRFREHHGFVLKQMLDHVEAQEAEIAALDERIEAALAPFVAQVELLRTIPGVDHRSAQVILAEIGPDMSVFPTAGHLASWVGMCPGQRDSGRHGSAKTRKGSKWLRGALVQSAARPHAAKAPTCPNATGRSCAAAVMPRPSSPSATRSCSPPTACWPPHSPTPTPAQLPLAGSPPNVSLAKPSDAYKTSATKSPSSPAPTQHDPQSQHHVGLFSEQYSGPLPGPP